jgi:hypothetical protein
MGIGDSRAGWSALREASDDYFPNLLKIELFARRRRKGWLAWGAEAPDEPA